MNRPAMIAGAAFLALVLVISAAFAARPELDVAVAGLASVTGEHYEGGHWLGSFATYLVTERGLR